MRNPTEITYVVNARDQLVSVGEGWLEFAEDNGGDGLTPESVKGRELWDFIHDEATRQLYREVLARVRKGRQASLMLRCDGPCERRLIELVVTPKPQGNVEFKTMQLAAKRRSPQRLLDRSAPRSADRLQICGWCDRVNTGVDLWMEIEEAVKELGLADRKELPELEPATCPVCHEKVLFALEASTSPMEDAVPEVPRAKPLQNARKTRAKVH